MTINKPVSLNLDVRGVGQSATLSINDRVRQLRKEGRTIYNFGLGQSPFPVPSPVVNALRLHAHEKEYLPVRGLPQLREAVAQFHKHKDHVHVDAENVIIGPGSKELMFLLQIVFYGELIIPTPCWVSYVPQAQIIGRKVSLVHSSYENGWQICAEDLRSSFESENDTYRPRVLVLNYPSNPTGGTYSADELKAIAEVVRKYQVIVLSDEIYGQLNHRGEHVSIARYYPEGTIISSGLSKWCGAGGWRLGTFTVPKDLSWLLDALAAVASETYTSVSAPIQFAAVTAFKGDLEIERYLWHVRRILAALGKACADVLIEHGLHVRRPEGAFYLFPDFEPFREKLEKRGIRTNEDLCERLLQEAGVAILPGIDFQRPARELTARLAYINFDGAKALAASETIPLEKPLPESFLETHCGNTFRTLEKMLEWLNQGGP